MSDDGEPHGTAGRPMLNALLHGDLGDVVAVVVRYYGGVKLGTGGLARAYTSGVVAALGAAESRIKVELGRWHVGVAYDLVQAVEKAVGEQAWSIAAREFGEAVTLVIEAPRHEEDRVRETLADATSGRASVREEGV